MVNKYRRDSATSIKADIIVLGCSLPGIVAANKLKTKFGNSMDIVVLDLAGSVASKVASKCNVAFRGFPADSDDSNSSSTSDSFIEYSTKEQLHNAARQYLLKFANEFKIPLPEAIIKPGHHRPSLHKLFQYRDGNTVPCTNHFTDFSYLNFVERFELNQYMNYLDKCVLRLFQTSTFDIEKDRDRMLYYDRTTMEKNICDALLLPTSREIMRTTVELVCGAPANTVSLLFYLHQCHRSSGSKRLLDGQDTRFREKLLGYARKRISSHLLASIADITLPAKSIKHIRPHSDSEAEQVILETMMGETTYICSLLAMAIKPDQLQNIEVDNQLLPEKKATITKRLTPGKCRKFIIQYEENFWESKGYSGDILSMRGPIIWAMERPSLSLTGSVEKYAALIGYVMVSKEDDVDSKEAVVEQLISLFGLEAAHPVTYRETSIADLFIPRCGDYLYLRMLTGEVNKSGLEWSAFDIFAEGDVAAAIEAGHTAYLNLLGCLRPQAQTYEDISAGEYTWMLSESPLQFWISQVNVVSTIKLVAFTAVLALSIKLLRSQMR